MGHFMDLFDQILGWALDHLDELKLIGILASAIGIIVACWRWLRGRDTNTKVGKVGATAENIAETASEINEGVKRIEAMMQAQLADKFQSLPGGTGSSGPDGGGQATARDLSAAIATIAAEGKIAALDRAEAGDTDAADAVLADKIAQIATMRAGAAHQEAMLYRQRGALAFLHDTDRALRAYAKAAELDPDDAEGWFQLGQLQMRGGYLPAAKASFERLLALRNSIPEPWLLHWAHMLLGDVEATLGNRPSALVHYDQAVALIKALVDRDPNNDEWQRDLAVLYIKIGDISASLASGDKGFESYEKALDIFKAITERNPKRYQWQCDLSWSYKKIGKLRAAHGDSGGALAYYREALHIAQDLDAREPKNKTWQLELSSSYEHLGDIKAARSEDEEAVACYANAIRITSSSIERDPNSAELQYNLAVLYIRIGDMSARRGDNSEALASYEDGLRIAKALVKRDPSNAIWQRDLSISFERTGDIKEAQGDCEGALRDYEGALAIAKLLTVKDPSNAQWQRDLSVSYERVGDIRSALGEMDGALASYEDGLGIRKALAARDPNNTE